MNFEQPLLSVIIPVHNRERYLTRCLESVAEQTMEGLEILVLDDASTDNTPQIIEVFQKKYPQKVRSLRLEKCGVAHARNRGIEEANGRFITFVDSDDYIAPNAYEVLCKEALEQEADLVCTPSYRYEDGLCQLVGTCTEDERDKSAIIYYTTGALWDKIFRADLLAKTGLQIPDFKISEDTAFAITVMTWAKKIIYVEHAYYHYELVEDSLSLNSEERPWVVDLVRNARSWMTKNGNPEYYEVLRAVCRKHLLHLYRTNVKFQDILWEYLVEEKKFYFNDANCDNRFQNPGIYLEELYHQTHQLIPQIVYINGFNPQFDANRQKGDLEQKLFFENCRVIILNKNNCMIEKYRVTTEAFSRGDYHLIGALFAVEAIFRTGGFYVGNRIQIRDRWNGLRVNPMFWAQETLDDFSDQIFGGVPGTPCLQQFLSFSRNSKFDVNLFREIVIETLRKERNFTVKIFGCGTFVFPEFKVPSLAVYKDYLIDDFVNLAQLYFSRTKREYLYKKQYEWELLQLKNKAYQDTLWQQEQRKNLQTKLNSADDNIFRLQSQRETLLQKLDKANTDFIWQQGQRKNLQTKLKSADDNIIWLQGQRESLLQKLDKTNTNIIWLQSQRENLLQKLDKANTDFIWLQEQYESLQIKLNNVQNDILWLQNQRGYLDLKLEKAKKDITRQQEQQKKLQQKLDKISKENEDILNSYSYRIGYIFTYLPRQLYKLLLSFRF